MATIPLTKGYFATVDDDLYEELSKFRWHVIVAPRKTMYAARRLTVPEGGKIGLMHRLITKANKGIQVDHIDGNGLNNQRLNLRPATNSQNLANRGKPKNNSSGYKGVSFCKKSKNKPWIAVLTVKRKAYYLGNFTTPVEAGKAYDEAAIQLLGEFAFKNFPEPT